MLSTTTVFHFLGPIWCLSICSWTGNIGAYKWVMYCDLPLEQHYLIKERASLHCVVLSLLILSLRSESFLFHFIILSLCLESFHQKSLIAFQLSTNILSRASKVLSVGFPPTSTTYRLCSSCTNYSVICLLFCCVPQRYSALVFPPHQRPKSIVFLLY